MVWSWRSDRERPVEPGARAGAAVAHGCRVAWRYRWSALATTWAFCLAGWAGLAASHVRPAGLLLGGAAVLVAGIGAGGLVVVWRARRERIVETAWQIGRRFRLPVLGVIPNLAGPTPRSGPSLGDLGFVLACAGLLGGLLSIELLAGQWSADARSGD